MAVHHPVGVWTECKQWTNDEQKRKSKANKRIQWKTSQWAPVTPMGSSWVVLSRPNDTKRFQQNGQPIYDANHGNRKMQYIMVSNIQVSCWYQLQNLVQAGKLSTKIMESCTDVTHHTNELIPATLEATSNPTPSLRLQKNGESPQPGLSATAELLSHS